MAQAKKPPIALTGKVDLDWNSFTGTTVKPAQAVDGDLVIWSWSGDRSKPKSSMDRGELRVSVFVGKARRTLMLKRSSLGTLMNYTSDRDRETKIQRLRPELVMLKGRTIEKRKGGFGLVYPDDDDALTAGTGYPAPYK